MTTELTELEPAISSRQYDIDMRCWSAHQQTLHQQRLVSAPRPNPLHQALQDCLTQTMGYMLLVPNESQYTWNKLIAYELFLRRHVRLLNHIPRKPPPFFCFSLVTSTRKPGRNMFQQRDLVLTDVSSANSAQQSIPPEKLQVAEQWATHVQLLLPGQHTNHSLVIQ